MKNSKFRLSSVFYAPNFSEMIKVVKATHKRYNETEGLFVYDLKNNEKLVNAIIEEHYFDYVQECESRELQSWNSKSFNLVQMLKVAQECCDMYEQRDFFKSTSSYFNYDQQEKILNKIKNVKCSSDEANLIAIGRLAKDIEPCDSDCYETAGGYRTHLAKAGTVVKIYLSAQNTIYMTYEASCLIDHYNNNFFGNSTGGGTTKYKYGENVSTRTHHFTGRFDAVLEGDLINILKWDTEKALAICEANIENA
jgi:hypothetical protein